MAAAPLEPLGRAGGAAESALRSGYRGARCPPLHPSDPGRRGRPVAAGRGGGAALFGGDDEPERRVREGNPPVLVDLGVRTDPRRRGPARGRQALARRLRRRTGGVRRGRSLQAEAGEAISAWPDGTLERLEGSSRRFIPRAAPCSSTSASPGSGAETRPGQSRRGGRRGRGRPTPYLPFGRGIRFAAAARPHACSCLRARARCGP